MLRNNERLMEHTTLPFPEFWKWLQAHPNCILRAGTSEAVLYDDEDLHWHLAGDGNEPRAVQLVRGKRLMGELLLEPERVTYVEGTPGEGEEFVFELISETPHERTSPYFFVLSHGYEDAEKAASPVH